MDGQQLGLAVKTYRGPSSVKIEGRDEKDAVQVGTDDGDLLSVALCSYLSNPVLSALIKCHLDYNRSR
jgi:hypothetical protein